MKLSFPAPVWLARLFWKEQMQAIETGKAKFIRAGFWPFVWVEIKGDRVP
ncbi:hypothetical protein [Enterovirga sp. CN4-39]